VLPTLVKRLVSQIIESLPTNKKKYKFKPGFTIMALKVLLITEK
jgi:hypothetical protein